MVPVTLASDDGAQMLAAALAPQVERIVAALDDRGRWLEEGMINSATFVASLDLPARYIAAANGQLLPPLALLSR